MPDVVFNTGSAGFQSSVQALIRAELIESLRGNCVYLLPEVAVPGKYVQGGGTPTSKATFRYFNVLDLAPGTPTPLVEGVTPDSVDLGLSYMDFTASQFGKVVKSTDLSIMQSPFSIPEQMAAKLAVWGEQTLDLIAAAAWGAKPAGEKVLFAQAFTDATKVPLLKDFARAAAYLATKNVPKVNGSYIAVVSPETAFNLKTEVGEYSLLDISKYTDASTIIKGEIGTCAGVKFIETSRAIKVTTVHRSIVAGAEAIAYSDLSLVQTSYISEAPTKDDALGQRAVAGTKMFFGARTIDIGADTAANSLRYCVVEGTPPAI